jgi:TrmH family RNA methyltransferase
MHITSRQSPRLKYLKKLGANPAFRRSEGLYLADGPKLLGDALKSGTVPVLVVHTQGLELPELPSGTEVHTVPKDLMDNLSLTDTPQGVLFACKIPPPPPLPEKGQWLLLDRVQDPGNVGSILRTAEAFGLDGVMLAPGCADPFSPKAVRAAMGAVFRLPVFCGGSLPPLPMIVTVPGGEAIGEIPRDCVVVLGNEGQGISAELREQASRGVSIPMKGGAESLGVAAVAAILCWEMQKG